MSLSQVVVACASLLCALQIRAQAVKAPSDLSATETNGKITLHWTDQSQNETGFVIDRGDQKGVFNKRFQVNANTSEWSDPIAIPGASYFYQVAAVAGSDLSEPSDTVRSSTPGDFKLLVPKEKSKQQPLKPSLTWTPSAGATGYDVAVTRDGDDKVIVSNSVGAGVTAFHIDPGLLKQDTAYNWQVSAQQPAGKLASSNGPFKFETLNQPAFATWMSDHHLKLQRAFEGDDATEGAQFSYSKDAQVERNPENGHQNTKHSNTAHFDFALIYENVIPNATTVFPHDVFSLEWHASIEAKLSNTDFDSDDALRFRLGFKLIESPRDDVGSPFLDSWDVYVTAKYETDQDFDIQKVMLETLFTPTKRDWGIGKYQPLPGPLSFMEYRLRPYIGFDWGRTFDPGPSIEDDGTLFRGIARLKGKIRFPIAQTWGLHEIAIYGDDTFRYVANTDGDDIHNYLDAGLAIEFTPNFGIAFKYKIGEDAPEFLKTESFNIALTVKI